MVVCGGGIRNVHLQVVESAAKTRLATNFCEGVHEYNTWGNMELTKTGHEDHKQLCLLVFCCYK